MTLQDHINAELVRLNLSPLNPEQVQCLTDPSRLEEAAAMLADLRDRCSVRLPMPVGVNLVGPCEDGEEAREIAASHAGDFPVVTLDEMATDDSHSPSGKEFRVTGYAHDGAPFALAERDRFAAIWVAGEERALDA